MQHAKHIITKKNKGRNIKFWFTLLIFYIILLILYFQQKSLINGRPSSIIFILGLIYIILGIGSFFFLKEVCKEKLKIEKVFLICIIPIGMIYTLLIPPGLVPDEWVHMQNEFSLSSQIMKKEINMKITMKKSENDMHNIDTITPNNDYYDYIYSNLFKFDDNNEYVNVEVESFDFSQIFAYFPAVIGITFSRIINLGAVTTVYVGRLFNFIFYTTLTFYAIKKIPFGKLLLFTITMLPMASHQMFTLSYDTVINSSAFFCIAYGLFFVYQSKDIQIKDIVLYGLCGILLLANKGSAYAFILIIPILAKYFNPNGNKIAKKTKIIIFLILLISILFLNYKYFINAKLSTPIKSASSGIVPWSGTESYTISSMFQDIPDTISLYVNTFIQSGNYYINTAIGSSLGWLILNMPNWIIIFWKGLLITSSIAEKSSKEVFTYKHKLLYFLISLAVILVVMLAMALAWTPRNYKVIQGVQGRYFIPIIFLLLIILQNSKIYLKENLTKIIIVMTLIMSIVSIYYIIPLVF